MANQADLERIRLDYTRNLAGIRTIYEPDGSRTYDHDPVALCGWCGDPLEADYEGGIFHAWEEPSEQLHHRWPPLEEYGNGYTHTVYEEIEMIKSGKGAIIPSVDDPELNEFVILSPGERKMLEVLFGA